MLAMQINSTIDGTEMRDDDKPEEMSRDDIPWLEGDDSD